MAAFFLKKHLIIGISRFRRRYVLLSTFPDRFCAHLAASTSVFQPQPRNRREDGLRMQTHDFS